MKFFQQKRQFNFINSRKSALNSVTVPDNNSMRLMTLELEINVRYFIQFLGTIIISLLALSVVGQIFKYMFGYVRSDGQDKLFVQLFDFDTENNIPSLFSVSLLFICCVLLGVITIIKYQQRDKYRTYWQWLSFIFLGLSIDEGVSIHEQLIIPLRNGLGVSSFLYFAWVIPAFFFVLLLGVLYLKFIVALPKKICHLFVLSGGIYLSGAIGVELIGGAIASVTGQSNFLYSLVADCEEFLELTGIGLFTYTLLKYIQLNINSIQLRFK